LLQGKENEQLTLFSDHNGSLLRRQPRAMTIGHSPKGVAARPGLCFACVQKGTSGRRVAVLLTQMTSSSRLSVSSGAWMSSHTSAGAPASCTAQAGMLPFSSALNPLPSCKQQANEGLLFGTFPLLGYWAGRMAQAGMLPFSSALNPFPSCKQKAFQVLLCGTFSLLSCRPGRHAASAVP